MPRVSDRAREARKEAVRSGQAIADVGGVARLLGTARDLQLVLEWVDGTCIAKAGQDETSSRDAQLAASLSFAHQSTN